MKIRFSHRCFLLLAAILSAGSLYGQVSCPARPIQDQLRFEMRTTNPNFAIVRDSTRSAVPVVGAGSEKSAPRHKSSATALLLSVVVPGGGEYYLGNRSRARYFFTGEALSWIAYASFRFFGHGREEDMIRFARERAGANLVGKSQQFQDMVGFYSDIDQYNALGRAYDPNRVYLPDTRDNHWRWQDPNDQVAYRLLKNRSREAYSRARFVIVAMVVNRALSVIDTYRELRQIRRRESLASSLTSLSNYSLTFDPLQPDNQVTLTWHALF